MEPQGIVAVTDPRWYEYLSARRYWDEVNFWIPGSLQAVRAPLGAPFFFKLKAPFNAIAGVGFFSRYTRLPEWLAWDCFGEANGCATVTEFRARLAGLRRGMESRQSEIGCCLLSDVVFFPREEWVCKPDDWTPSIQRYKKYELGHGEGKRVWAECCERVQRYEVDTSGAVADGVERYGSPILVRPRLGQGAFRVAVMEAYGRACSVTGEHSLPALEAAHIRPVADDGPHDVRNGLFLRADLHRLFDQGYVTVTEEHRLEVSRRLKDDFDNGKTYYPLQGKRIEVPDTFVERPESGFLAWHNENVFRG